MAAAIRVAGGSALVALGDLSTDAGADAVAAAAGEIDVLVNNAGGAAGTSAMQWVDVPEDLWVETYQANVLAAARMIRRLVPGMKARGWGRVINIASAAATQPLPFGPDYGAAKGAVLNLTCSLAKWLGPCGVTANAVSPGMVMTPAVEEWLGNLRGNMGWGDLSLQETERRVTEQIVPIPVGRAGRVEDIGHAVCMIASVNGGFMTGANVRVDGGQVQTVN